MSYKIRIDSRAIIEIQHQVSYYNLQQKGLGNRFFAAVDASFNLLKSTPFFQIKYDDVRCSRVQKFPFLVHFTLNESKKIVFIHGVIHTSLQPRTHWIKK